MTYDGTDASIAAVSTIRESSGSVLQRTHPTVEDESNGYNATHWAQHQLIVQSKCGAIVESDVTFRAIVEWPNLEGALYEFDAQQTGRSPSVVQPACQPCPAGMQSTGSEADGGSDACAEEKDEPEQPSGGGGGGCPECVDTPAITYCRVRYYYWLDTGEVFDYIILWCA
jgi:hypothetical protein